MQEVSASSQSFSLSPSLSDVVSSVSAFESSVSVASVESVTASYPRSSIRGNSLCTLRSRTSFFLLSAARPAGISPEGPNDPSGNLLKQLGWSSHATLLGFPFLLTQDEKWLFSNFASAYVPWVDSYQHVSYASSNHNDWEAPGVKYSRVLNCRLAGEPFVTEGADVWIE